jgi:penicillin-binding protein 2
MIRLDIFGNPDEYRDINDMKGSDPLDFNDPVPAVDQSVEEEKTPHRSFKMYWVVFIGCFTVLTYQCYNLQIRHGLSNRALSEGNSLRIITEPAERGLIEDYNGTILVQNSRQLALTINPSSLPPKKAERDSIYSLLKAKAGITDETIAFIEDTRLKSSEAFAIKSNLSKEDSLLYTEWFANKPGVSLEEVPIRQYTASYPSLGQITGYVGQVSADDVSQGHQLNEQVGKSGLEKTYNQALSGTPGTLKAEVNAFGETVRIIGGEGSSQPVAGATLKLSLDGRLQQIVSDALQHALQRRLKTFGNLKEFGASAVVLDPSTGAVKAMVSLPNFDNNLFAQGISQKDYQSLLNDPGSPLLNRAIQGQYPSGSTIKPMVAAAALQEKIIGPDTQMFTPAAITIGQWSFPDWKFHGQTNTRKAIAESNDVFFYAVGGGWQEKNINGLGVDKMGEYLRKFGFGSKTGIDIDSETSGLVPTPDWKAKTYKEAWYIGDTYHESIGQGYFLATPLQMANATAAIANGGTVWKPQIGWSLTDPSTGKETLLPHTVLQSNFISPANIQTVKEGMRMAVQTGSAHPLNTLKVTSAGKTGTAEFGTKNQTHAWYTGFAPYENPQIAFSIMIEAGGESFDASVPVAEEILRGYFNEPLAPGQKLSSEPNITTHTEFDGEH